MVQQQYFTDYYAYIISVMSSHLVVQTAIIIQNNFSQFNSSLYPLPTSSSSENAESILPPSSHARTPCPSPTPGVYPNSCPLSRWCYLTISSSVIPFSSCLQSFPTSWSFQMSQFFTTGGQSVGVSASSALPMTIQDWFPLGIWKFTVHVLLKPSLENSLLY